MGEGSMQKERVTVSPEMAAFIGEGMVDPTTFPADAVVLCFTLGEHTPAQVTVTTGAVPSEERAVLILAVERGACLRVFDYAPDANIACHLPSELRLIVVAIRDCALSEPWRSTHRSAKCIELLSITFQRIVEDDLVPLAGAGQLSARDSQRIVAAKRMIDERWGEKMTLDSIARACGLNRAKLTRGFRDMFACTVADALLDRRLGAARQMLVATDLPVSSIGYQCGYLNNASFTRAFSRQFGATPSSLRAPRLAA
ncbi:helix-turn-helix transcriptional regulator [Sphingomonas sp. CFBP 13714]|uniref:helix-turn-helix transcriptional regulator n=1 Tax=Sphingomonas sp. CFBP 13714 TaxID=2775308 RepID=UPI0031450DCC